MILKKIYTFILIFLSFFSKKKIKKISVSTLYYLNLIIFNYKHKLKKIPIFQNKNSYEIIKINFTNDELKKIYSDLEKKNYIEKNFSFRYLLFSKNIKILNEVEMSWGFSRRYYVNLINKKIGDKIRSYYGNGNYRFEHFWMWKTPRLTMNVNSKFHVDNDMPGALKILIYLNDVDENGGPFAVKEIDEKIVKIKGNVGTAIIFDQNKCNHAGLKNLNNDRFVLVASMYPTLRKEIIYDDLKPINSFCEINPFTKLS